MLRDTKRVAQSPELGPELTSPGPEGYVHLGQFVPHFGSLETGISVKTCTLTPQLCVLSSTFPGKGYQRMLGFSSECK